jgi:hypothetical protein
VKNIKDKNQNQKSYEKELLIQQLKEKEALLRNMQEKDDL